MELFVEGQLSVGDVLQNLQNEPGDWEPEEAEQIRSDMAAIRQLFAAADHGGSGVLSVIWRDTTVSSPADWEIVR